MANITWHDSLPDDHPIFKQGWTTITGRNLNPNLRSSSDEQKAEEEEDSVELTDEDETKKADEDL